MKKWEVLDSYYLYQTPYGNLRRDKCLLEDGKIIEDYNVNEFSNWVNGVVLTKDMELILTKQYRHGAEDFFYEIPAGSPEKEESYSDAISREVLEETGYTTATAPIFLGEFYVNPSVQNNKVFSFLLINAEKTSEQLLDENESIEVYKVKFDEAKEMIKNQKINQMFSVLSIYLSFEYLSENIL